MLKISYLGGSLIVAAPHENFLAPRDESMLALWGFSFDTNKKEYTYTQEHPETLLPKVVEYFRKRKMDYLLDDAANNFFSAHTRSLNELRVALQNGRALKEGALDSEEGRAFAHSIKTGISRALKEHQFKAALHLLSTENAANFSVPGSGKTSVVLAVFHHLKELDLVDSLFIVGPPACFGPWKHEYQVVLGCKPSVEIFAGGDASNRRSRYFVNLERVSDLYLTSFQTLQRDVNHVKILFENQGIRFFLVVDEAHYIKQPDGAWANAVLSISKHATRRCILTGTPFPRSYEDGFNLFEILWPNTPPISPEDRSRIVLYSQRNQLDNAADILEESVGPLFYRVRKADLGLAPQVFHEPIQVTMNKYERFVYDTITDRIQLLSQSEYFRNVALALQLRRGRMIRIRQAVSFTPLLSSAITEYDEDLLAGTPSLSQIIRNYVNLERPGKIDALASRVQTLTSAGEKVVIWSNFIGTLKYIQNVVREMGLGVRLIYGATPIQRAEFNDEQTREEIVSEFCDPNSDIRILVANPAACAESISLHKICSHAFYYDLSYNCAQYLQSLDRIHRVGGSENKISHYYFLQYENTIDRDILLNVQRKSRNMGRIIDRDYPIYSLDMFEEDEELEAYARLFKSR